MEPLVSVITPAYNNENTISETIESVLGQTYKNIELIIVDDISTDGTVDIIKDYQKKDDRVKFFQLSKKGGAAIARNKAIKESHGKYVAFLDADDLWKKDKLEKQIDFMEKNNIYFSYTDYEYIDEDGIKLNIYRKCPKKMSYFRMLLGDSVGCLTVVYNRDVAGDIEIPNIKKRNDYALWCQILKKVKKGYKCDYVLACYRKSNKSLSSGNKIKLLKYHYQMHREINEFNTVVSSFFTFSNVINFIFNIKLRDKNMCGVKYGIK